MVDGLGSMIGALFGQPPPPVPQKLRIIPSIARVWKQFDDTDGKTINGLLQGSPYGTTVYIGHVAYKKMGATRGYSLLNGVLSQPQCAVGSKESFWSCNDPWVCLTFSDCRLLPDGCCCHTPRLYWAVPGCIGPWEST
eukprot:5613442-Amphidinium_carterae.1